MKHTWCVAVLLLSLYGQVQLLPTTIRWQTTAPENSTDGDNLYVDDIVQENDLDRDGGDNYVPKLWPNGIVHYTISNQYSVKEKGRIIRALRELQHKTCVKMIYVRNKPKAGTNYLKFTHKPGTCGSSYLGMTRGEQLIWVNRETCFNDKVVWHEVMHALGFRHEHTRPDRDGYIEIQWDKVKDRACFRTSPTYPTLGLPYDVTSVMHPGTSHCSTSPHQDTFTTRRHMQIRRKSLVGERRVLSEWDVRKINTLYRCAGFKYSV